MIPRFTGKIKTSLREGTRGCPLTEVSQGSQERAVQITVLQLELKNCGESMPSINPCLWGPISCSEEARAAVKLDSEVRWNVPRHTVQKN